MEAFGDGGAGERPFRQKVKDAQADGREHGLRAAKTFHQIDNGGWVGEVHGGVKSLAPGEFVWAKWS